MSRGRDAAAFGEDRMSMLDSSWIPGRRCTPDVKPTVINVPGDEGAFARTPIDNVLTVPDSETFRVPSGAQVSLDGPFKAQPSRTIRRVLKTVLYDQALLVIRAELKTVDIQVVQHPAIDEPVAIRICDHLHAFRKQDFPIGPDFRDPRPEAVDELDRGQPQPAHFTRYVVTHVGELAILCPDQVSPVACRHVGLLLGSSLIADAGEDVRRIIVRGRQGNGRIGRELRSTRLDGESSRDNKREKGNQHPSFHRAGTSACGLTRPPCALKWHTQ